MTRAAPDIPPDTVPQPSLFWCIGRLICRIFATLAFDLKAYGTANIPRRGGVLLVANHQSYLDPVLVGVPLRRPVCYMAKSELFHNRWFAWLIRSLHAFPVRQGEGDVGAVKETIRRLKEGNVLNIYPEGSRCADGEIAPLQTGVSLIIRRARVPVVPVAIAGAYEAWPMDGTPRAHPVRIVYGPPMILFDMKAADITPILEQTLRRMFAELRTNPDLQRPRRAK